MAAAGRLVDCLLREFEGAFRPAAQPQSARQGDKRAHAVVVAEETDMDLAPGRGQLIAQLVLELEEAPPDGMTSESRIMAAIDCSFFR